MIQSVRPGERRYASSPQGPAPTRPTDRDLKRTVVDRLRENLVTSGERLRVDVRRGVVVLSGQASSPEVRRAAATDPWCTVGVAGVRNQLTVGASRRTTGRGTS